MFFEGDLFGLILSWAAILVSALAAFLLFYGVWRGYLQRLFSEAKELEERSILIGLRKATLANLAGFNRRFKRPRFTKQVSRKIRSAGGLESMTPPEFMALQEVSCVGFLLFGLLLIWFFRTNLHSQASLFWVPFFGVGGWFLPQSWLRDQVKKRHQKITRALPYNLDLLTLSVEAGLDFQAAVYTVVQKGKKGPLLDELDLMMRQLRMGKTRQEALREMADRVDLYPLTSFVNALIQADRMGTSLGRILRIQSTQLRIERTQRAEKLANEAPVKMLFPLIACIFPTVFMVLFGPIIFQFIVGAF